MEMLVVSGRVVTILKCYTYRCGDLNLISRFNAFYVARAFAEEVEPRFG